MTPELTALTLAALLQIGRIALKAAPAGCRACGEAISGPAGWGFQQWLEMREPNRPARRAIL